MSNINPIMEHSIFIFENAVCCPSCEGIGEHKLNAMFEEFTECETCKTVGLVEKAGHDIKFNYPDWYPLGEPTEPIKTVDNLWNNTRLITTLDGKVLYQGEIPEGVD